MDPSSLIFFRIFEIKEKGGKAYQNSLFQEKVNALIRAASGSLSQEQYFLHFVFARVANKSIVGLPKELQISWKASFCSSHSVSTLVSLDPSSARFSFDATYSANSQISLINIS